MASTAFGSGCLLFPLAISRVGPIIALILLIIIALLTYWTLYILLMSGIKTGIMDYNKLLEQFMGRKFSYFSDIINILSTIGALMTYQNFISQFTLELLFEFFNITKTDSLKLILMFSMMFLTQLPLSLLRDISKLQYASILCTISLIYVIIVMIIEFPNHLMTNLKNYQIEWFPAINWRILDTLSIFLYGFSCHLGMFPILQEIKNPIERRNYKIIDRAFILVFLVYLAIAFSGYFSVYPFMVDLIINADCYSGTAMKLAKIALVITLTCKIAINYNIMRQNIKALFFSGKIIPYVYEVLIAFFLYLLITYLTYAVKEISIIMGFFGGFVICLLYYFNPIAIYILTCGYKKTHYKVIGSIIAGIIMTGIGISATIFSIYNFVLSYN